MLDHYMPQVGFSAYFGASPFAQRSACILCSPTYHVLSTFPPKNGSSHVPRSFAGLRLISIFILLVMLIINLYISRRDISKDGFGLTYRYVALRACLASSHAESMDKITGN